MHYVQTSPLKSWATKLLIAFAVILGVAFFGAVTQPGELSSVSGEVTVNEEAPSLDNVMAYGNGRSRW